MYIIIPTDNINIYSEVRRSGEKKKIPFRWNRCAMPRHRVYVIKRGRVWQKQAVLGNGIKQLCISLLIIIIIMDGQEQYDSTMHSTIICDFYFSPGSYYYYHYYYYFRVELALIYNIIILWFMKENVYNIIYIMRTCEIKQK